METKEVEYRVRPVTRYIITRWHRYGGPNVGGSGSEVVGMFESAYQANRAATALHKAEAGSLCFLTDHTDPPVTPASDRE